MESDDRVLKFFELPRSYLAAWGGETKHGNSDGASVRTGVPSEPGSERHAGDGRTRVVQGRVKQRVHPRYIHNGVHHRHVCLSNIVESVS